MFVGIAGVPVIPCTVVLVTAFSATFTEPTGSVSGAPHVPLGAAPAATVCCWPPAVNVKLVPAATPIPPILQMTSLPVGPRFVNVTDVVPTPTTIVALLPGRSDVPCCAPAGDTTMLVVCTSVCVASFTVTIVPTRKSPAGTQFPFGPAPAATVTLLVLASVVTAKVNVEPTATPTSATLQTSTVPGVAGGGHGVRELTR